MEENAKGATELNREKASEIELEEAKQELYEVKKQLDGMELPKGFEPVSISKHRELQISNRITEKDVIAVELENEEQERQTLLYKRLEDRKLSLIATIDEKDRILLSDEHKEKYKNYISREELERPYALNEAEMERQKEANIPIDDEKEQMAKQDQIKSKTGKEFAIAMALRVSEDQIVSVIEVKDESTMSNVVNRDVQAKDLFIVRLRQGNGNDYVMMNRRPDGSFEVASKTEMSKTFQEINQGLGIKNNRQEAEIKEGELGAVAQPYGDERQVEVNRYRFRDETSYILEVQTDYQADMHLYREEEGKLIPLCTEEHGRHETKEIELPNRVREVEEDEGRTPWGDAEGRRSRY